MLGIGLAPILLLSVLFGVTVFGIPLHYLAPAAAIAMCLAAYRISRRESLLTLGIGVGAAVASRLMYDTFVLRIMHDALSANSNADIPQWLHFLVEVLASNGILILISTVCFFMSLFIGIIGPTRVVPDITEFPKDRSRGE